MVRKFMGWALVGMSLALACPAQGHGGPAPVPEPAIHGCSYRTPRGSCCQRFCAWLCYRPLPVPKEYRGCLTVMKTPTPPLYTYFIGLYGPRSPSLGFPTTHVAHGPLAGDSVHGPDAAPSAPAELPPAEENLPAPRYLNEAPSSKSNQDESRSTAPAATLPAQTLPLAQIPEAPPALAPTLPPKETNESRTEDVPAGS
jgi:hypothetical protein